MEKKSRSIQTLLFFLLCFVDFSFSNTARISDYHIKVPKFTASPKIDGIIDEEIWNQAAVLDSFTQYEPQESKQPSERTVAFIGNDEKHLYIAVCCYDSNPRAVRACLAQRDKAKGDGGVTIYLDTFNDKKRAFAFQVNPCGVQSDGIYMETHRRGRGGNIGEIESDKIDRNWDAFFLTDAEIHDEDSVLSSYKLNKSNWLGSSAIDS
ncbi:MAG: carbohydrate binding family 9 domain-containing protein [Candidatus Aminicenantales bacterium]